MGLKKNRVSAAEALAKIDINAFQPIELTQGNVEVIFNRCLKSDKTVKETDAGLAIDYTTGKVVDSEDILVFDEDVVKLNLKTIQFLLGQLKVVHDGLKKANLIDFCYRYDSTHPVWTSSEQSLYKLCYLGSLSEKFLPIMIKGDSYTIEEMSPIQKTISPRDPNFPAWWEAHKAEWEG